MPPRGALQVRLEFGLPARSGLTMTAVLGRPSLRFMAEQLFLWRTQHTEARLVLVWKVTKLVFEVLNTGRGP